MKRAVITVGLGFGDEGKGATVDYLCRRLAADLVVRYSGGSQAGHNVQLPDGRRHTFSQFGAGTLIGVRTYLAAPVIIHPTALVREAEHLHELGVADPLELLRIHPDCLVSTHLHQTLNHLRELSRGVGRHGSCGHGIGETRSYWLRHGSDAIFARDLHDPYVLAEKLELLRQRVLLEVQEFADRVPREALSEYALLSLTAHAVARPLLEVGERLDLSRAVPSCETAVFEGAQGVLLDEWFGFHPHTTWSTVTPHHALEIAAQCETEEVSVLGLVRPFMTRHGAGPLPTYDAGLTVRTTDVGNPWNRWQESLRAGWLDLVLLRYAARSCGRIDSLVVNCLDQLPESGLRICREYNEVKELDLPVAPDLKRQEATHTILCRATPLYEEVTRDAVIDALRDIAPVSLLGFGPTHLEREMLPPGFFRDPKK